MSKPITRKDFLCQAAATTVALGTEIGALSGETPPPVPIIDTHTHFYDPTRAQGVPWPNPNETLLYKPHLPEQFRTLSEKHGVVGTVVVEASAWVEDNQWILDLAQQHSIIVGFIGHLDPGKPEFTTHLQRFSANPLFRGLRLNGDSIKQGLGQQTFEEDLRRLEDRRLTIDVLGGASMLPDIARLAKFAPALRIVIDHLPFREWSQEKQWDIAAMRHALAEVADIPNVYAKVSDVARRVEGRVIEETDFYQPALNVLWEMFGPDRAIFGSNWPVSDLVAPYAIVHKIVADYFNTRGHTAAEKFFWKNSLAAYSWQPRGAAASLV